MPRPGFVLSNFRSASEDTTPTPRGEKEFGVKFNSADWALKIKNILKLRSLPYTAHCGFEGGLLIFINFSRATFFISMSTQMVDVYLSYLPMKQI